MIDKKQFMQLWNCCEYFMAHAPSGVNLASFDLIKQTYQGQATADAFICERLTRPVLAKSAKGIKRLVEDYVERNCLGQLEKTAKSLEESLKASLTSNLLSHFETVLVRYFLGTAGDDAAPEVLLSLAAAYHAYYKNKVKTGMGLPPWFFSIFFPLLVKSQKGDMGRVTHWQQLLKKKLSVHWAGTGTVGEKLCRFLEDDTSCKVVSLSLSGILGFIQEEKDKVFYLFEVTHQLTQADYKYFQTLSANGLNSLGNRQKRFIAHAEHDPDDIKIGLVSTDQIRGIVTTSVDRYFDPALDWCVQYQLSLAAEQPRRKLARQFDKTFLAMNRDMWKELLILADTQRRVVFRTRHLLRILIYYLFESRGTDRSFWQKYIASVDRIIHAAFAEEKDRLRQFNTLLGKRLSVYRNTEKYQGTDWEGFCTDTQSRDIALGVIREIGLKARSDNDPALPAFWFSRQVETGVDDRALYRFFAQGPALG